jgi:hypothetical protein
MYYNMLLLQKWHGGALPQVGRDERGLRQRAAEMAGQTLAQVETP